MKTETIIDSDYKMPKVAVHECETPNFEARIALSLVEKWGLVAADADGEDSSGRAKLRRLSPDELVAFSCDTAQKLAAEFSKRGWMIELPSIVDHMATKKSEEDRKEQERRQARVQ